MELVFKKLNLKIVKNERAIYSFAELNEFIDFEVRRIYFLQDFHADTGQHCHKIEKELFIMQCGTCTAIIDRGNGKEEILISGPGDAIYVGAYVWHGFKDISPDAVLMALSSTNYNPDRSDYVEDYDAYREMITKL
ncbi:MAG TPA: FdtA/QdtA family cupin domain-containing protein [Candidatus Magasanikbacteria bacterium]|nr:FdtA/QdtA family cupin domain-containing protein [Candidatus Magasanikbacteria bacterium]